MADDENETLTRLTVRNHDEKLKLECLREKLRIRL
jgi:hypothetical protein